MGRNTTQDIPTPTHEESKVLRTEAGFRKLEMESENLWTNQAKTKTQTKKSLFASIYKPPIDETRPRSMVVKKANTMIPAHIIAEAISTLHDDGQGLRWSGPITPTEMEYVEQYVLAKYPQYACLTEGEKFDLSSICVTDDERKSPTGSCRSEPSTPSSASNLPELDRTQLAPSRLLDILTTKATFSGSFVSIPEIQARNKVLKHCGLPENDYLVLFTASYVDSMKLVGESYPFVKGNTYMNVIGSDGEDPIKEYASFKEARLIPAPASWLDLRIKGSQISQYFRKKSKCRQKGLFSYPYVVNGTQYSLHWVSEAHRNSWHVLLDATELVIGKDSLNLVLHRPDFVLCSLDNAHASPSKITCLLIRKKSFDTSVTVSSPLRE